MNDNDGHPGKLLAAPDVGSLQSLHLDQPQGERKGRATMSDTSDRTPARAPDQDTPATDTPSMGPGEPLAPLEAAVWGLFPGSRHVLVVLQVLDQSAAGGMAEIAFRRGEALDNPTDAEQAAPLRQVPTPPTPRPRRSVGRPTPTDRIVLDLVGAHPGLASARIARRLRVKPGTARERLARLVRRGWLRSNHATGYHLTDLGRQALGQDQIDLGKTP